MSEFTKGEWIWIDGDSCHHKELVVKETLGEGVDSILYHGANWPMDKANARLIAAAPDLLDACKELNKVAQEIGLTDDQNMRNKLAKAVVEAEAAIAKAKA